MKTQCIVFDIDCTLAIKSDRNPYDYTRVQEDTPHHPIATILFMLMRSGAYIVFCTGREEKCRHETIEWLKTHVWYESIPHKHSALYMRAEGDYRPDWEVKEELWKQIETDHNCEIVAMFDDRKQVIDHARKLGYTVLDVAGNTF